MQKHTNLIGSMETGASLLIIYDGECPFCSAYAQMLRLKETFGAVRLINARSEDPVVKDVLARGMDIDKGIIVEWQGAFLQADEALHFLALASTPSTFLNRINQWIFRSPRLTKWIYPFLYKGRSLALFLLGRKRLEKG